MYTLYIAAPSPYDCNFETGLCSWKQAKDDQFDWTRNKGGTSSGNTGPSVDHTKGTASGYYVFIETSTPRVKNDKARLVSAVVKDTTIKCLHFWYHMYGPDVNTLNVYTMSSGKLGSPVWTKHGTVGNKWMEIDINITPNSTYQIVFEGVRGTSYQGDIAIDDISLTNGLCG